MPREERVHHVVEVAKSLFIRQGYLATSTAQIAREAGIAEMTLFRYFATKKDLFAAVIAPLIQIQWFSPERLGDEVSPKLSIITLLHERFLFVKRESELVRLVIIESQLQTDLAGDYSPIANVSRQLGMFLREAEVNEKNVQIIINLIMGLFLTTVFASPGENQGLEATFNLVESQIIQLLG